ncbi:unnamed protein product [Cunninghamella echinulata]
MQRVYDILPCETVQNVPMDIQEALSQRYQYIIVEQGKASELTVARRTCCVCQTWCASADHVKCAGCQKNYHMKCVTPPLTRKPSKGFAWQCAFCSRKELEGISKTTQPSTTEVPPAVRSYTNGKRTTRLRSQLNQKESSPKKQLQQIDLEEQKDKTNNISSLSSSSSSSDKSKIYEDPSQVKTTHMWPFRYYGVNTNVKDILDVDDRIYPRAASRIGSKYQAIVPEWKDPDDSNASSSSNSATPSISLELSQEQSISSTINNSNNLKRLEKRGRPRRRDGSYSNTNGNETVAYDDNTSSIRGTFNTVEPIFSLPSDLNEEQIDNYIKQVQSLPNLPISPYSPDLFDKAFLTLEKNGYVTKAALKKMKKMTKEDFPHEATWNADEIKAFETSIAENGHELNIAKQHIPSKSMADIVRFFYQWKKTNRYEPVYSNWTKVYRPTKKFNKYSRSILDSLNKHQRDDKDDLKTLTDDLEKCNISTTESKINYNNNNNKKNKNKDKKIKNDSKKSIDNGDSIYKSSSESESNDDDDDDDDDDIYEDDDDDDYVFTGRKSYGRKNNNNNNNSNNNNNNNTIIKPRSTPARRVTRTRAAAIKKEVKEEVKQLHNGNNRNDCNGKSQQEQEINDNDDDDDDEEEEEEEDTELIDPTVIPEASLPKDHPLHCLNCSINQSDIWRRAPGDTHRNKKIVVNVLCNDCGIHWLKYGKKRPVPDVNQNTNAKGSRGRSTRTGSSPNEMKRKRMGSEENTSNGVNKRMRDDTKLQITPLSPCHICLSMNHTKNLVACSDCNMVVHEDCYGVNTTNLMNWQCDVCKNKRKPAVTYFYQCTLCGSDPNSKQEAMKPTSGYNWAHITCSLFFDEIKYINISTLSPVEYAGAIEDSKRYLTCKICLKSNVGACYTCSYSNCQEHFHVQCALENGYHAGFIIQPGSEFYNEDNLNIPMVKAGVFDSSSPEGVLIPQIYCPGHKLPNQSFYPMSTRSIDNQMSWITIYSSIYKKIDPNTTPAMRRYYAWRHRNGKSVPHYTLNTLPLTTLENQSSKNKNNANKNNTINDEYISNITIYQTTAKNSHPHHHHHHHQHLHHHHHHHHHHQQQQQHQTNRKNKLSLLLHPTCSQCPVTVSPFWWNVDQKGNLLVNSNNDKDNNNINNNSSVSVNSKKVCQRCYCRLLKKNNSLINTTS